VIFLFIVLKKIHIFMIILGVVVVGLTVGLCGSTQTTSVTPVDSNLFIIDAGHGGMDGGAQGASGLLEKDVNLKVAGYLKELLEDAGKTVIMTRETDQSLHTTDSNKIRDQKRSDLKNRKQILSDNKDGVFVSIHMNKFEQSQYRGAQVFYANNDQSRILGEKVQKSLIDGLADGNTRVAKKISDDVYILKGCDSTAVVVECGFLSNPEEEKLLGTEEYQRKLAQCIFNGLTS
jgi:N-acetylmuramoyl-L-alanine amidase